MRVLVSSMVALSLLASCAASSTSIDLRASRPHRPSATTRLELPPIGRAQSDRLVDGDPVWVVRTTDDEVHVLAATARTEASGRVERVLVDYDPGCQCFRGMAPVIWGLDGAITAATEPDYGALGYGSSLGIMRSFDGATVYRLDRYDFRRDGETIDVGARWTATEHVTSDDRLRSRVLDVYGPETECAITTSPSSLSHALGMPEGRMVLVSANIVREGDDARLCSSETAATCDERAPRIYDDTGLPADRSWVVPGPILARRFGDGFVEVASAHSCASAAARCEGPAHDRSWLRTPIGADEGISIDAPVACEERQAPEVRMIGVHGRGTRRSSPVDAPEGCGIAGSDPDACPTVPATVFHQALFDALSRHGHVSFGIGACFESSGPTDGRLAAVVHDWRYADAAIRVVSDELARWDLRDSFWVSVEPMPCGELAATPPP